MTRTRIARLVVAAGALVATLAAALVPLPAAQAAALGPFSCLPVNGLSSRSVNPPDDVMKGILRIPGYAAVTIGTGSVNWGMDPFGNASWRRLFLSMKWAESLTDAYTRTGNSAYLARAQAIAKDFAANVPAGGGRFPADAWTPMYAGQRATVYTCIEAKGGSASWITSALNAHGGWLATHDPGDWNQGVDAAIGLLGAACRTGNATWAGVVDARFTRLSTSTIDAEGVVLEQAPGYGAYLLSRWNVAVSKLEQCGRPLPAELATRTALARDFLAWMTTPAGTAEQIGDSTATAAELAGASDALGYAVSKGALGTAPAETVKVHANGYAVGRSSWSPFASSTYWTLRFGPGRAYHGHEDHGSVTLHARGEPLLIDSGHFGYTAGAFRDYLVGPWAHNTTVAPGATFSKSRPTALVRQASGAGWNFFELTDAVWDGRSRTRRVLVDTPAATLVVWDNVSRATAGPWRQLWHLPVGARTTISGRSVAVAATASGKARLHLLQVPLPGQVLPAGSTQVAIGSTNPYLGWVARTANERVAAPVVTMSRLERTTVMATVIVAGGPTSTASATARTSGSGWAIDVVVDGVLRTYRVSGGGSLYK